MLRSATAANVLHEMFDYNTRSCGTGPYALIPISTALVTWADIIVCMEQEHLNHIVETAEDLLKGKTVLVLRIRDDYNYNDDELKVCIKVNFCIAEQIKF